MTLASLAIFAGTLLIAAGSPGPSIAALVARVLSRGARDVFPFLAAMWVGELVWLTCAVLGLAALAETFHYLFVAIKWIGVAYLVYLAWQMWTAPAETAGGSLPEAGSAGKLFFTGLTVTLGNPKIMMFYVALVPTIIDMNAVTLTGWAELVAVMLVVLVLVDLAWVLFAARARLLLRSARAIRIANRTSAGLMAGAAAAIAAK
jgi:threonine/homoserine/homoserine lactone efflux protein